MTPSNYQILFQGDSITDAKRNRFLPRAKGSLGHGYAKMISEQMTDGQLRKSSTGIKYDCLNRGISGDRIVDLYARWKVDGINLQPDLISILIGVNDTWHEFGSQNGVEVDRYAIIYRLLLEYTREKLPETRLVLCEPFVLPCGVVTHEWQDEMAQRREIVQTLAQDFNTDFVPFQRAFDAALNQFPAEHWAGDGVHPTTEGHQLMADLWLETVKLT